MDIGKELRVIEADQQLDADISDPLLQGPSSVSERPEVSSAADKWTMEAGLDLSWLVDD